MRIALVVALLAGIAPIAVAQQPNTTEPAAPFGIRIGAPKAEVLNIGKEISPYFFELKSVPKPHPDFVIYTAQITPKHGVCYIRAASKDITTNSYGSSLTTAFDAVRAQLQSLYGKSKLTDYLSSGSIWNESKDWMMGMLKKDRYYFASWAEKEGSTLKPGIKQVAEGISALNSEKGYIWVEYYSDNDDDCELEIQAAKKSSFPSLNLRKQQ